MSATNKPALRDGRARQASLVAALKHLPAAGLHCMQSSAEQFRPEGPTQLEQSQKSSKRTTISAERSGTARAVGRKQSPKRRNCSTDVTARRSGAIALMPCGACKSRTRHALWRRSAWPLWSATARCEMSAVGSAEAHEAVARRGTKHTHAGRVRWHVRRGQTLAHVV